MNLMIIDSNDFISASHVRIKVRRYEHLTAVLKVKQGDVIKVGQLNGLMGEGKVETITADAIILKVILKQQPPKPLALTVIMALSRPPMLKRTLQYLASFGVKKIIILHFNRVEKSLWNSSALKPEAI